jgi:hypothetical protein
MQQVLADDAGECLLHLVWLHRGSSDILTNGLGVSALVCNQQLQVQFELPIYKRKRDEFLD